MAIIQGPGVAPYRDGDNTRDWVETYGRKNGILSPALAVMVGTDSNYMQLDRQPLYGAGLKDTKSLMNLTLPGMRVPGIQNWTVTESLDNVVQTATMDILNCLYVSTISTTLSTYLPAAAHSPMIRNQWVSNSIGVVDKLQGNAGNLTVYFPGNNSAGSGATSYTNTNVQTIQDFDLYYYREDNVKYRLFAPTSFTVANGIGFPDPSIPDGEDADDPAFWVYHTASGVGSYFIRVGNEIIRVHHKTATSTFYIPPGGRGIAGTPIVAHNPGETVTLLGIGPRSGQWDALGYLNLDDTSPQTSIFRPGTCFVSYEGWGTLPANLSHSGGANYQFTGYWFVIGAEPSMAQDGIPKIRVDMASAGWMLEKQKITPDLLRRAKTQFGQWRIGEKNQTIWGASGHTRDIPGDWVDYDSWDPSLPQSYPLQIKTELAQHKEFYDHMMSTEKGARCEICRQERNEWLKTHKEGGARAIDEQRAVGKHIYKQSIRILREKPMGPIKTFIRLMATLAMASWDNPAYGTELAQAFTKIPNELFDNMRDIRSGRVYAGQLTFELEHVEPFFDWFSPTYDDKQIMFTRRSIQTPFEATYDKAPFYQPMIDLAEVNGNMFWVDRRGRPIFKPRTFSTRRFDDTGGEWFQRYGASIDGYSSSINTDAIVTQVWISATSAFESKITVLAGGTGINADGSVTAYSPLGGNRRGLALTSGVQQVETISLDNLVLGLAWDTSPAAWGAVEDRAGDGTKILNAFPPIPGGAVTLPGTNNKAADAHPTAVKRVQSLINFFLLRFLIRYAIDGKLVLQIKADGNWRNETAKGVEKLRELVNANVTPSPGLAINDNYTSALAEALDKYKEQNAHYIKFDVFWYVMNDRPWEEYLSAITGVPIKTKGLEGDENFGAGDADAVYAIDDVSTQAEVGEWTKSFSKMMINAGNRFVDDTMNKAVVRTVSSNYADPRILPGDLIWVDVPGFLTFSNTLPFNNGIYVTNITRTMDLAGAGNYTATYSGYRFVGSFRRGLGTNDSGEGYLD